MSGLGAGLSGAVFWAVMVSAAIAEMPESPPRELVLTSTLDLVRVGIDVPKIVQLTLDSQDRDHSVYRIFAISDVDAGCDRQNASCLPNLTMEYPATSASAGGRASFASGGLSDMPHILEVSRAMLLASSHLEPKGSSWLLSREGGEPFRFDEMTAERASEVGYFMRGFVVSLAEAGPCILHQVAEIDRHASQNPDETALLDAIKLAASSARSMPSNIDRGTEMTADFFLELVSRVIALAPNCYDSAEAALADDTVKTMLNRYPKGRHLIMERFAFLNSAASYISRQYTLEMALGLSYEEKRDIICKDLVRLSLPQP